MKLFFSNYTYNDNFKLETVILKDFSCLSNVLQQKESKL